MGKTAWIRSAFSAAVVFEMLRGGSLELRGFTMPNSSALYFQGATVVNGGAGVTFGDGVKFTGGPFVRLGTKTNSAGASSYPTGSDLSVSAEGLVTAPGSRHYQVRYRNAAVFCSIETFNYTNAVTIVWAHDIDGAFAD